MAQFVKKIQNFAFQNDLWFKKAKIIAGVSGGPDSVCLLHVLIHLAEKYDFELHIAHVNYGLRGEESKKDELLVRGLAKKYGIKMNVLAPKKSLFKGNLESSLRNIRYEYFEKLRKELKYDLVAVAHNQDDQAETVLMRIIRGSGLNGLGAMKAKTGFVIRPLLKTSKKEILAFLKQKKMKFRIDKTNLDIKFMRNSVRHKLIPYLEKNFNPSIRKTLCDWSFSVADDYDFIAQNAQVFATAACKNKCAHFSVKEFLCEHGALQRQIIRNIIQEIKGETDDIESKQVEEMIKLIKSVKNKAQKANIGGLNISKKGDKVDIFF